MGLLPRFRDCQTLDLLVLSPSLFGDSRDREEMGLGHFEGYVVHVEWRDLVVEQGGLGLGPWMQMWARRGPGLDLQDRLHHQVRVVASPRRRQKGGSSR